MFRSARIAGVVAVGLAPFACGAPARDPSQCAALASVSQASSQAPSPSSSSVATGEGVPASAEAAVTRLLSARQAEARWFSPSFLAQVPIEKLRAVVADMHKVAGAFVSLTPMGDSMTVSFERGRSVTRAAIDDDGRFTTLWFGPVKPIVTSVAESIARVAATPGEHSVLVTTDGKDRATIDADRAMPIGSAFKLAVLATLRDEIDHKKRKWTDVVRLSEKLKSLPSGALQSWPDGAPLTIYSLAAAMISVSDNTAADTLARLVGRAAIEPRAPHARPLLTTREAFTLKAKENATLLDQWRAADEGGKRTLLDAIDARPLPSEIGFLATPTALDVEWFFSARELCALIESVHDLDLTSINPGPTNKRDWDAVSYKGGSEAGVLNFTTWVKKGTHTHCVSATWKNESATLDTASLSGVYAAILDALAAEDAASATGS